MRDELWDKLDAFTIGDSDAELDFTRRLARENDWSREFAERVIGEYKRFVYLAMRAGHHVTPSDEVDQAWHLHLLYTQSYWHDLCRDTLERPLHHGPTRGGSTEGAKFRDWYAATLESYERLFGEVPPRDIWPSSERRFSIAPYFRRINIAEHYVVPKRRVGRTLKAAATGAGVLGLAGCATVLADDSPTEVVVAILVVIGVLVLASIIAVAAKRHGKGGSGCGSGGCYSDDSGDSGCGGCGG